MLLVLLPVFWETCPLKLKADHPQLKCMEVRGADAFEPVANLHRCYLRRGPVFLRSLRGLVGRKVAFCRALCEGPPGIGQPARTQQLLGKVGLLCAAAAATAPKLRAASYRPTWSCGARTHWPICALCPARRPGRPGGPCTCRGPSTRPESRTASCRPTGAATSTGSTRSARELGAAARGGPTCCFCACSSALRHAEPVRSSLPEIAPRPNRKTFPTWPQVLGQGKFHHVGLGKFREVFACQQTFIGPWRTLRGVSCGPSL